MKKIFCITLFCTFYWLQNQAQFFIGPSMGINQYFIHTQTNLDYEDYKPMAKLSPSYGIKSEVWFSKYLFLSAVHQLSYNRHNLILSDYQTLIGDIVDTKFNHIQNAILINKNFENLLDVGIGLNHLYTYAAISQSKSTYGTFPTDTTFIDKNYNLNEWGGIVSLSKAVNSFIFEINYAFATGNIVEDVRRFSHAIQLNVAYLFKTNVRFSKKGLDCPRF